MTNDVLIEFKFNFNFERTVNWDDYVTIDDTDRFSFKPFGPFPFCRSKDMTKLFA